jgi:hypothetical protein
VIGFTFCVQADDAGSAATIGLALAQAAGAAAGEGPDFYDIVVVPHSAIVVPLHEFDIPMPDRAPNCRSAPGRIGDPPPEHALSSRALRSFVRGQTERAASRWNAHAEPAI